MKTTGNLTVHSPIIQLTGMKKVYRMARTKCWRCAE